MNADHISPFLFGALCGAWAAISVMQWAMKRKLKAKETTEAATLDETRTPQPLPAGLDVQHKPASDWHSLPGGRIELGATGFYITINPSDPPKIYQGFTPEHERIVYGRNLPEMKRYLEEEARERAEFDPPKGGWR